MLKEVIQEYENNRIKESEYLAHVEKIMNDVLSHKGIDFPIEIASNKLAKAIFGVSKEFLGSYKIPAEDISIVSLFIAQKADDTFNSFKIINRHKNNDIINKMKL
jgi:hypothetical protein